MLLYVVPKKLALNPSVVAVVNQSSQRGMVPPFVKPDTTGPACADRLAKDISPTQTVDNKLNRIMCELLKLG